MARYTLYYWTGIQGRGEFVRLALEQAGAPYRDICRDQGDEVGLHLLGHRTLLHPPFAMPVLVDGDVVVAQTAAILLHLGPKLGLAPADPADALWTHQIQLTIADAVAEAHNVHHPIANALYYDDQKPEAARAAEPFRQARLAKFLEWLETILARNPAGADALVGSFVTYADLSAYQLVAGLRYAFPNAAAAALARTPRLAALAERVAALPNIAAYLDSPRRLAFNQDGIFRHYPELDQQAPG